MVGRSIVRIFLSLSHLRQIDNYDGGPLTVALLTAVDVITSTAVLHNIRYICTIVNFVIPFHYLKTSLSSPELKAICP